jgi:hypothetical protein
VFLVEIFIGYSPPSSHLGPYRGVVGAQDTAAGWLPVASASQTAAFETPAAASGTHPNEPESEQMQLLCPESIAASKPPASPRSGSTSQE